MTLETRLTHTHIHARDFIGIKVSSFSFSRIRDAFQRPRQLREHQRRGETPRAS